MSERGSSYSLLKDGNGKVDCPIVRSGMYNQKLVVIYVYSCDDVYIIVDVDLQLVVNQHRQLYTHNHNYILILKPIFHYSRTYNLTLLFTVAVLPQWIQTTFLKHRKVQDSNDKSSSRDSKSTLYYIIVQGASNKIWHHKTLDLVTLLYCFIHFNIQLLLHGLWLL